MGCRKGLLVGAAMALLAGCDDAGGGATPAPDAPISFADTDAGTTPDAAEPDVAPDVAADPGAPDEGPADTTQPPADTGPLPDTTPGVTQLGGGVLLSELDSGFVNAASAVARFTVAGPPSLSGQTFGPCVVGPADPNAPAPVTFGYDAGAVTVAGTTPAVTLTPMAEGAQGTSYASTLATDHQDLLPGGGALVTLSAAGGKDLPAFSLVVQAPEPVILSAPATGLGAEVSTGGDVTVTWNKGTGQQVLITLNPLDGSFQAVAGTAMVCEVADTGSAVLPKAALTAVRGTASSLNAALGVTRLRQNRKVAGSYDVPAALARSTGGPVTLTP